MARAKPLLTDGQWAKIQPLLPPELERPHGGRPRCDDRKVLEGILWMLENRGALARSAQKVSQCQHLLAAAVAHGKKKTSGWTSGGLSIRTG